MLVIAGTTGESPTLTTEEKLMLFSTVVEAWVVRQRLLGTGSNNTKATVEFTKEAERTGVDGILLVAPTITNHPRRGYTNISKRWRKQRLYR